MLPLCCQAEENSFYSTEDLLLEREMNHVKQMWALSKDFRSGTTVEMDEVTAYAWLSLYVESLPESYPGLENLLDDFRLSQGEATLANELAQSYREKYDLHFRLSESDLDRILQLKENPQVFPPEIEQTSLPDFQDLLIALKTADKDLLAEQLSQAWEQTKKLMQDNPKTQLVYGQVNVLGPEDPQRVIAPFPIFNEGYFVGIREAKQKPIQFLLNGYQAIEFKDIHEEANIVNLGVISLSPLSEENKASIMGKIEPNRAGTSVNVVLQMIPNSINFKTVYQREPWWWPVTKVNVEPDGKFHMEGLSPSRYRILVSRQGERAPSVEFTLKPGEKKQLGTFHLNPESQDSA